MGVENWHFFFLPPLKWPVANCCPSVRVGRTPLSSALLCRLPKHSVAVSGAVQLTASPCRGRHGCCSSCSNCPWITRRRFLQFTAERGYCADYAWLWQESQKLVRFWCGLRQTSSNKCWSDFYWSVFHVEQKSSKRRYFHVVFCSIKQKHWRMVKKCFCL